MLKGEAKAAYQREYMRRRRAAAKEQKPLAAELRAKPEIDPASLSLTAQGKLAAAIRQHTRKLDREYEQRRLAEIEQHMRDYILPTYNAKLAEYDAVVKARKGVMTAEHYKTILRSVHPDNSASAETRARAFRILENRKLVLVAEAENPTATLTLPKTPAEWAALKAKVAAQRKAERAGRRASGSGIRRS